MRAKGSTDHDADGSRVPAVVQTEGSVSTDHGHREERHFGPNRKPGRPSFRGEIPPVRDTSSLRKHADDLACFEPGQSDPERANRGPATGDRNHADPAKQPVEDGGDAEELIDRQIADRLSHRCSDDHWIEM